VLHRLELAEDVVREEESSGRGGVGTSVVGKTTTCSLTNNSSMDDDALERDRGAGGEMASRVDLAEGATSDAVDRGVVRRARRSY
tara:strand:+ start:1362 stop:1616 length:255 start_codon:yes stop_codon:yes gene_type:complete